MLRGQGQGQAVHRVGDQHLRVRARGDRQGKAAPVVLGERAQGGHVQGQGPADPAADGGLPGGLVGGGDVVVDQYVVQPGRGYLVTQGLQGQAMIAGGEGRHVQAEALSGGCDPLGGADISQ
ncbi:hypothetical protein Slala03_21230 [Streptomyces lavendulae subsp. lavendulae]|nr:hypothetical protein Slala03_21230 [Streptomyces lavendulae subsp. lavendulae]